MRFIHSIIHFLQYDCMAFNESSLFYQFQLEWLNCIHCIIFPFDILITIIIYQILTIQAEKINLRYNSIRYLSTCWLGFPSPSSDGNQSTSQNDCWLMVQHSIGYMKCKTSQVRHNWVYLVSVLQVMNLCHV
jgi:hypothetical protein